MPKTQKRHSKKKQNENSIHPRPFRSSSRVKNQKWNRKHSKHRRDTSSLSIPSNCHNADSTTTTTTTTNDDVLEQLQRQRAAKKRQMKESNTYSNEISTVSSQAKTLSTLNDTNLSTILGGYQYDPIRKAYFPIQDSNVLRKNPPTMSASSDLSISYMFRSINVHPSSSVYKVLEKKSILPYSVKRRVLQEKVMGNMICHQSRFQPTVIPISPLYKKSNNHRDMDIDDGADSIVWKSENVYSKNYPARSLKSFEEQNLMTCQTNILTSYKGDTHSLSWVSMLSPLCNGFGQDPNNHTVPNNQRDERQISSLDCKSRFTNVMPSSRTFAIVASKKFPHIATTTRYSSTNTSSSSIHFRSGRIRPKPYYFNLDSIPSSADYSEQLYLHPLTGKSSYHQSIRMCPNAHASTSNANSLENLFLGSLAYDLQTNQQRFQISTLFSDLGSGNSNSTDGIQNHQQCLETTLDFLINDFAFSSGGIRKVAFAPSYTSSSTSVSCPTLLDVPTMTLQSALSHTGTQSALFAPPPPQFQSDTLCIEYWGNSILYGQRNGSIQIVDARSGTISHSIPNTTFHNKHHHNVSIHVQNEKKRSRKIHHGLHKKHSSRFGSVSSITCLDLTNEGEFEGGCPTKIVTGGSFGPCDFHDIRRTSSKYSSSSCKSKSKKRGMHSNPSLVWSTEIPASLHCNPNASSRCTGVAISPDRNICVKPFISNDKDNLSQSSHLGLWSLRNGSFLGKVDLIKRYKHDNGYPLYCELSNTITSSWKFHQTQNRNMSERNISFEIREAPKSWGVWLKCGSIPNGIYSTPIEAGGIHHIAIPN